MSIAQNPFLMLLIVQVKPISKTTSGGCQTINVETYGGGLWYTWFDRDLGIAGRVLVRQQSEAAVEGSNGSGKLQHRLVKIDKPVLRIPMLAIHLSRNM
jgi:aspartyl aminopeptidase